MTSPRPSCHSSLGFAACALISLASSAFAQSYSWKNVALSGAGAMVTGIIAHPGQQGLYYIRTDVGGSYRWDATNSKWIPLNDSLTFAQGDFYACESIAIDPSNVNTLYYAGGLADYQRNGAIFKSTDKGTTWTQLTGISVYMDGNGDRRWAGERLVVSPANSNIILFGSRKNGLWRSTNGGTNWAQVAGITPPADSYGVQSVAFDPSTPTRVYAAVSAQGVSISNDSGATWRSIGGSTNPRRLEVSSNGTVWLTTGTGVSKYTGGTWTNYAPAGANVACNALGINPTNANEILIAKEKATSTSSIWRTTNGGTSWTQLAYTVASTVTWNTPALHNYRPTDFLFDPFNTAIVWGDRWRTPNIAAATVAWTQQEAGHEEDVVGALIAPPSGTELLAGVFDDDGFAMNNGLDAYPTKQLGIVSSWNGHTWGMAYQETNPQNMFRLGTQNFYGGVVSPVSKSTDGGATWNRVTTFPANLFPLACAVSATNGNAIMVICNAKYSGDATGAEWKNLVTATSPWRYSTNGGTTWAISTGLPTPPSYYGPWGDNQILAADKVNGSKFYYLDVDTTTNTSTGKIYRSVNSGGAWAQTNPSSLLPASKRWYQLKVRPGLEGDVWACFDNWPSSGRTADEGLYRSTNSGVTWTKVANVNRTFSFGFGKSTTATPALYIYGRINGGTTDALYRSLDLGVTWASIQSPTNNLSDFPSVIEGSRQTANRVFVGSGGRGVFYGSDASSTPYGGTAQTIPGIVEAEKYDLGGEGVAYHDTTTNNNGGQFRLTEGVDIETCTDTGGGYDISYTAAGEWMKYTVNVAGATTYIATFRVASANNGATFHLENESGTNISGPIAVPNTGSWTTWGIVTKNITLPAGTQTLKVVEDTGGFNLNYILFN